jgi:RNA polymerase sigma factor (sigma-70 family)
VNSHAGAVLDQLDRLFNRGTVAGLSEGALLERYVAGGDEAAFAALVARHGPMVLGVCRRVLRDERDVEDAFQATFLVLVRRAGAIRDGDLVGRWLHGVAHRVAVRARAHSARRFVHEQSVSEPIEAVAYERDPVDAERHELAAIVDEEVTRLPSPLRAPVVLCYLEGMSHDEAARRLRWPVGTVRSRMARARDVLRHRLARRGVTADGEALAATLVRLPVPPEWLDATVRGSLHFATHPATAAATIASARSVAIARRILQTMTIAKLSCIGAAGLGLILALGGVRTLAFQDPQEAKPIGVASAPAGKLGGQPAAPEQAISADRRPDDRIAAMSSYLSRIEDELKRSNETVAEMREQLRKVRGELDSIARSGRAAPARPTSSAPVPPTPARTSEDAVKPDRPRYIRFKRTLLVVSPDGSKIGLYEPMTGNTRPLKLPPIQGVRREIIVNELNPLDEPDRLSPNLQISAASSAWFVVLDLDRDRKVTRIGAFNCLNEGIWVQDETWIVQTLPEPVDRSSVKSFEGKVYAIGRRLYAFSERAKRWGALEFPPGTDAAPSPQNPYWAEKDGRLFLFNGNTGNWDDVYLRAIDDAPSKTPR